MLQCGRSIPLVYAAVIQFEDKCGDRQQDNNEVREWLPSERRFPFRRAEFWQRFMLARWRAGRDPEVSWRSAIPTLGELAFEFLAAVGAFPARLIGCGL